MKAKDMAYEKGDAMEACRSIGRKFIQHFDKIYNRRDCEAVNHWRGEMQGWFNDAKSIKLKQSKKYIDNNDLWDWFFTAGAEIEDYMLKPNAEEISAYEDFVSDLNITKNVRQSIANVLGIKIIDSLKGDNKMKKRDSFDIDEDEIEELVNSNKNMIESYVDEKIKYLDGNEDLYPFVHDYDFFMDWVNDVELDMTDDINNGQYEAYSREWDKLDRLVSDIVENYLKKKGINKDYKANIDINEDEMEDSAMRDSEEDLGWVSTPELLEREDFKEEYAYKYWVEELTELKNSTTKKQRLELAQKLMGYLSDFSNRHVKEEVRNDLRHVIMQHDYFFGDSKHKKI